MTGPADLRRQLRLSLELATECARLAEDRPAYGALSLDHLAHAEALVRLVTPAGPAGMGEGPAPDRLTALLGEARSAASRACRTATGAAEADLLGMIAAALATHEVVIEAPVTPA